MYKRQSKSFDGEPVIRDISIELHKGELVSLLGISGGGKTTLFNIIAGLSAPDKGRVVMDGEDITGCPGHVSYMLQKDLLFPFCTIEDNVALPLIVKGVKKKEARQQAGKYFAGFGLEGTQKKYPAQLSGGMRQRAALLRTYLFSGSVALLDEPFSALDMLTKQSVHGWYLDVMEQIRLSTLFITPVSYTHLDVYKRQVQEETGKRRRIRIPGKKIPGALRAYQKDDTHAGSGREPAG